MTTRTAVLTTSPLPERCHGCPDPIAAGVAYVHSWEGKAEHVQSHHQEHAPDGPAFTMPGLQEYWGMVFVQDAEAVLREAR